MRYQYGCNGYYSMRKLCKEFGPYSGLVLALKKLYQAQSGFIHGWSYCLHESELGCILLIHVGKGNRKCKVKKHFKPNLTISLLKFLVVYSLKQQWKRQLLVGLFQLRWSRWSLLAVSFIYYYQLLLLRSRQVDSQLSCCFKFTTFVIDMMNRKNS